MSGNTNQGTDEDPILLENTWSFLHQVIKPGIWDSSNVKEITSFNTIIDFWATFNQLQELGQFLEPSNALHMLRKGVLPTWEHPENANGGEWIFRAPKDKAETVWKELVLAIIGEQFADILSEEDDICGITVVAKPLDFVFQVWHRSTGTEAYNKKIMEKIRVLLPDVELNTPFYKAHKAKIQESKEEKEKRTVQMTVITAPISK